jgi:hypothetical protein
VFFSFCYAFCLAFSDAHDALGDCYLAGRCAAPPVLRFPFHPRFPYQKRLQTTRLNLAGNRRTCYVKLLCNRFPVLVLRGERMGGFEPPGAFSVSHTLSERR